MKFLFKTLLPLLLVIALAGGFYAYSQYTSFAQSTTPIAVERFHIEKGSSIRRVAKSLENKKIIRSAFLFTLLAKKTKLDTKIKAGEYSIKKGMTPEALLRHFSSGKTLQYQTRLPEGVPFKALAEIIKKDKNLVKTLSDDDYQHIMAKVSKTYAHHKPEGWFYPDTYSYPKGTTDLQFLQRSHNAMVALLMKEWEKRKKQKGINTPYDALILASIIEKETANPKDRGKIARVFLNRLEKDMLLQTDPTVIYGMGNKYKGNIRKKDLLKDTPYNTYTRKGLTPTPITTPSEASIKAVFNPADGDMLYFVAKGNGNSHFSKTYAEHKKAVIKYLLNGKANRYKGK